MLTAPIKMQYYLFWIKLIKGSFPSHIKEPEESGGFYKHPASYSDRNCHDLSSGHISFFDVFHKG